MRLQQLITELAETSLSEVLGDPFIRSYPGFFYEYWEPKRVESFLRAILPDATTIDAYAEGSPLVRNRGFAFVSFADVGAAVRAKEKLLTSPIKMGGRVLTVDWARAEHTVSAEIMKTGVARVKIQRTYGFVRFHKRAQAEAAMEKHNGAVLNGSRLEVSWARPPPPGRTMKKTPPIGKHRLFTMNPQIMQQPVATHGFEGLPLLQVEAPLFTSPVLDVPLLTPAQTPVSTTPAASSMPLVFVPPPHQLPVPVGPFPEQSHLIKSFSERVRNHGLGDVRVITSAVVVNNLIFYVTTILVGYVRLDGPLAPSKSEAEQNAIVFASNYLNIPIC
nr:APOBEC1 complementation factor-like isoform 1 [Haemonchus contortus]